MNTTEADPARMQYFNPTVAGAFEALEHLASAVDPVSVTEITSATRLTRGTALRVMQRWLKPALPVTLAARNTSRGHV